MRGLTSIAKFSTLVYAACAIAACSTSEAEPAPQPQSAAANDASNDTTTGVAETMTAAMGASTRRLRSRSSPQSTTRSTRFQAARRAWW